MSLTLFGKVVDERFLNHRLKSTSLMGIVGGVLSCLMFSYRFYITHVWSWDLFIVAVTMVTVKLGAMTYYRLTD